MKRCSEYGIYEPIANSIVKQIHGDTDDVKFNTLTQQVLQRNQKLEKYRQKKELEDKIKLLKVVMKREQVDEVDKREFYVNLLKISILDAQEELASIEQEKQILCFQQKRQHDLPDVCNRPPVTPLKPIIITRDLAQKAIYGLG